MQRVVERFGEVAGDLGLRQFVVLDRFALIDPRGADIVEVVSRALCSAAVSSESIVSRMCALFQSMITSSRYGALVVRRTRTPATPLFVADDVFALVGNADQPGISNDARDEPDIVLLGGVEAEDAETAAERA